MKPTAIKCTYCYRTTLDPTGLCIYHVNREIKTQGKRNVPHVITGVESISDDSPDWLYRSTGIRIANYSTSTSITDLEETEQFASWMKARVTVRAIESTYARKGSEAALQVAKNSDDTSLALIWERINTSSEGDFSNDGLRDNFVNVVRTEVERRVDSGSFAPLDISGYVEDFKNRKSPQGSSTFF